VSAPTDEYVWWPSAEVQRQSNWQAFIDAERLEDYFDLQVRAGEDPEWFWNALIRFLGIRFFILQAL